jgi:DEAD/DEAH box helicase domain-containing protein
MQVERILSSWRAEPTIGGNIEAWEKKPAQPASWRPLPADLHPALAAGLQAGGIRQLYSHQALAWQAAQRGENVVVVTGTASGKTLCYNLPVLNCLLNDPKARAVYLFPTKALAQDQISTIRGLTAAMPAGGSRAPIEAAIYDGDTPSSTRSQVRGLTRLLLTNPDMIHTGILPHHTLWAEFFRNLRFIVIDEIHIYRGVFGSHVANVVRRIKRVARFYGSHPQFVLTSATIGNPAELAERLIEEPVEVIDQDGAARGERNFLIYNPPIIDRELGLRQSASQEGVRLAHDLIARGVQTILFARTRRTVELLLMSLRQRVDRPAAVRGYRSGYLPAERRDIEHGLRSGTLEAVVATSALELGIDIGGMGASILVGYPGTIAAARQRAGRAGRKTDAAVAVLVASAEAIDQFLAHHPEYLFDRTPEQALIQPDNLLILLQHIRCAAFELPFHTGEAFGRVAWETVLEFLEVLEMAGVLHKSGERYYWMADQYPAAQISLRTASAETVLLQVDQGGRQVTIGQVDHESSLWMVHPEAVYLHEAESYLVENLDLEKNTALLRPANLDYFTEPTRSVTVERQSTLKEERDTGCVRRYGDLIVTAQVTGFRKVNWQTRERMAQIPLDLPPTQLNTTGYWITLDEQTVKALDMDNLWTNAAIDYGPQWGLIRLKVLARDGYRCQVCGAAENGRPHHVHHKVPFRTFATIEAANRLENLITVCPPCHHRVEQAVRMRSGLAGVAYMLGNLAPLFVMCDQEDLGVIPDAQSPLSEGQPAVCIYDNIPAGIGLSERLFSLHSDLLQKAYETVSACECADGCPACVGPAGENGAGGKKEALAIFQYLVSISPPGS